MSISTNLFANLPNRKIVKSAGCFQLLEYNRDISVDKSTAINAYFAGEMNIRKRQVIAVLRNSGVVIQAGDMQMMVGDIQATSNVKGAGDLLRKAFNSTVTGETAVKPCYRGSGFLVLEPTYKHVMFINVGEWQSGIVLEDGLFLACEETLQMKVTARKTLSSAIAGNEGFFNTLLVGSGYAALESPVPEEELFIVDLVDDTIRIDGSMAIAWSNSLTFTVEKTTRSLMGSAASGEGFVNVYRGTGRILIAPVG